MLKRTTNSFSTTVAAPAPMAAPEKPAVIPKKGGSNKVTALLLILLILSIAGFAWAYMNYRAYQDKVARLSTTEGQQELVKQQTGDLVNRVRRLIVLPTDEEPTVATVLDAAGLAKDQPFYKDAQNGDKVLIYVKAQKAIIYSEAKDILVNVGPVFIENRGATPAAKGSNETPPPTGQSNSNDSE